MPRHLPRGWVACDPGGSHSGLVSLIGVDVVDVFVLDRADDELIVDYARRVADRLVAMYGRVERALTRRAAADEGEVVNDTAVALEGVVPITPHAGDKPINPTGLVYAAVVLGACAARFPNAAIVRPGRMGSNVLAAYPAQLVSDGERRRVGWEMRVGTGQLRHARSAYDVAQAAKQPHNHLTSER